MASPLVRLTEQGIFRGDQVCAGAAEDLSRGAEFDLLEHQVKQIFRDVGIPVLSSQLIASASELKQAAVAYPLILKPQVYRPQPAAPNPTTMLTNSIDAIAAAHRLFDRAVEGEYPEYLLVEPFCPAQSQVGLMLWQDASGLSLRGWHRAAGPAPQSSAQAQTPVTLPILNVGSGLSWQQAQELGRSLGFEGVCLEKLADILERMFILREWLDLEFLAIDPLAIDAQGELVVLDGQIRFTADAIERQPEIRRLFSPMPEVMPPVVKLEGNIGVLSNGMGSALTTIDGVKQAGGSPAAFISLKEGVSAVARRSRTSQRQKNDQFKQALENLARLRDVKLILVNWESLSSSCREVAKTIVDYFHRAGQHIHLRGLHQPVPLVVCLNGPEAEAGRSLLADVGIVAVGSIEEAIAEGVGLAKVRRVS